MVDPHLGLFLFVVGVATDSPPFVRTFGVIATDAVLGVFAVLFLVSWWRARTAGAERMAKALLAPAATVVAGLVGEVIKLLFREERPCHTTAGIAPCPAPDDWSFPSSHSVIAGSAAVALALVAGRVLRRIALACAVFTAASRVFVGVHYPHDVAAGLLLGALVVTFLPMAARRAAPVVARLRSGTPGRTLLGAGPR
ncbi:phosphatase PAP2 family protein [Saccharothrix violaceirubra]|uniref:Undecaprenyl-diphosphatase n=1 Tax=Saccharothrix violaceirubra TaxID=413306 RepID=A0A7W7WV96_9PSEU|nr:phosphatase PAP2 family protein [Saccharothrix violaceirubra]MBB4965060.1 undecaprenyl-diphosphatase [Saccharothrix violaceirubra]